ncbi:PAQR family membrane homeostasis protein TrhA [Ruegeria profundi]|uniref:PAQR family membrane homeostasis protein TrhA n=1 Tax=Ruegeria profundi TaxID=1685378 RepID=UPI001CD6DF6C|nr:hemolysin III family protein [Ruegeria profundi]MCA0928389.1 hemolysin III family protein [Ruegeria profundi]
MWRFTDIRPAYTRAERVSDGVVHILGVALALMAVPVLITITAFLRTEPEAVLGVSIYGATLVMMLTFSALYNMVESDRWSNVLRRLDHSGIYVKIAGTYTPFVLLSAGQTPGLLVGLWSSATIGSVLKLIDPSRFRWFGLFLYLMMGWAIVWAGQTMLAELSPTVIWLIIAGGVVYTAGVGFYLLERLPFHNTIWHVFVLTGSVLFFLAIFVRIVWVPHAIS